MLALGRSPGPRQGLGRGVEVDRALRPVSGARQRALSILVAPHRSTSSPSFLIYLNNLR